MLSGINKLFGQRQAPQAAPSAPVSPSRSPISQGSRPTYAKVFRWRLPEGHAQPPSVVEVAGSFNGWQKVSMQRDASTNSWQTTIDQIPANKTHHYMILVDGQPVHDRNADGFAMPAGPDEQRYQLITERGPRVFMLFAQAK